MASNRRQFSKIAGAITAGVVFGTCPFAKKAQAAQAGGRRPQRRKVVVAGRPVKTIDIHAHCEVPEAWDLVKSYEWARPLKTNLDNPDYGRQSSLAGVEERLAIMDAWGIDVQAVSVNPVFWYEAERDIAARLIDLQNSRLAEFCAAHPDRFVGLAAIALQFPDLAAQQLEDGVKKLGMRGCLIGGSVNGTDLSDARFNPFWAKAEELGVVVFIHPQNGVLGAQMNSRFKGNGFLTNVIGNPLETTLALSHLIWEGTLDRYPGLKICGAHGGGYLPSYIGRSEACFDQVAAPGGCKATQKHPRDYLKQLYFDSMVFTPEGLRHLVAEAGASQIVLGTDFPFAWTSRAVDHILGTPGLNSSQREAMLGGTAARLLGIRA
jgi:aminocarboxymuconate-semialdehyde decarboxylase